MNITKNKLPDWFDGTIYDAGDNVTNPFTGEDYKLNWDDEMINLHQKALYWFRTNNAKAYMVLLD